MRNFSGGRGKNALDYMFRKYESDMYQLFPVNRKPSIGLHSVPESPQLQVQVIINYNKDV